jgi:hypothetical protein
MFTALHGQTNKNIFNTFLHILIDILIDSGRPCTETFRDDRLPSSSTVATIVV